MEEKTQEGKEENILGGSKKANNITTTFRKNPWIISTIALGLVVIVLLVVNFTGITGNVISGDDAGQKLVSYLNSRTGGGVTYLSSEDLGDLYKVTVSYQGSNVPVYVTKDGGYFVQSAVPITADVASTQTQQQAQKDIPKSDKPVADAFIFSYCPYGLQFEKALFSVYDLLKNKVDFNIVAIGAMHGEFEKTETLRQISIEKLYNKDKLFAYLKEFDNNADIGDCNGDDTCLNKYLPAIYSKLGIDKTKVENYMKTNAEAIYNEQGKEASSLGISGSPTFVINGVQVQVGRNAEAIKGAICDAFNTVPDECSQTLSTTGASAGFGGTVSAPQDASHPSTATGGSCA